MKLFLITYDLKKPGQDYKNFHEAIKKNFDWWHYLESTWLVKANSAAAVYTVVKPHTDTNDRFLIVEVGTDYAGWLSQDAWDWIKMALKEAA